MLNHFKLPKTVRIFHKKIKHLKSSVIEHFSSTSFKRESKQLTGAPECKKSDGDNRGVINGKAGIRQLPYTLPAQMFGGVPVL